MQITLRQVVVLLPIIAYFVVGGRLTGRAEQHLRAPEKHYWFTPMYEPELFTEEGNRLRMKALRFWLWGGMVLALYVLVF